MRYIIFDRIKKHLNTAHTKSRVGGRPKTDSPKLKRAIKLYQTKQYSIKETKELTSVKKSTLYRNLKNLI